MVYNTTISNIQVNVYGDCDNAPSEEIEEYVRLGKEKHGSALKEMTITFDGEMVDIQYTIHNPFERIRRITGYLVGTTNRFNNAKQHEEHDRVKHWTEEGEMVDIQYGEHDWKEEC